MACSDDVAGLPYEELVALRGARPVVLRDARPAVLRDARPDVLHDDRSWLPRKWKGDHC